MASFTSLIKQEIANNDLDDCCKRAQLSALIQLTSSISIANQKLTLIIRNENPTTAKRIVYLLKKLYKTKTELVVLKKNNLKKNNIYLIKSYDDCRGILEDLGIYSQTKGLLSHPTYLIVAKNCCARSYLAGLFLAYGMCNSPDNKNYHLELVLNDIEHSNFVVKLLSRFNIEAKISKRRNKYLVYLKKADVIGDFLRVIGSNEGLYKFEDSRISKDLMHSIVRIDNCEIANEMKSLKASSKQIECIKAIKDAGRYDDLDEKLKNVIDIRLKYQDYSLNELCKAYSESYGESISKSGLKHRLNKIENIAGSVYEGSKD